MNEILGRYGTVLAALALFTLLALLAPNFTAPMNLLNVVKQASYLAILAIGFTLALLAGELDLSVGQVATLASVVCAALVFAGQPWPLAALAGFLAGPMRPWERAAAVLAASVLVLALPWTDELGFALAALVIAAHLRRHARRAAAAAPP